MELINACKLKKPIGEIESLVSLMSEVPKSKFKLVDPVDANTALHWAICNDMHDVATLLIATNYINPDKPNNEKTTPLMLACCANDEYEDMCWKPVSIDLINLMKRMSILQTDNDGDDALIIVCERGLMKDVAIKLIDKNKSCIKQINKNMKNALFYACKNNMTDVVLKILENDKSGQCIQVLNDSDKNFVLTKISQNSQLLQKYFENNPIVKWFIESNNDKIVNAVNTKEKSELECVICAENSCDQYCFQNCGHTFAGHQKCVVKLHDKCPFCRTKSQLNKVYMMS